MGSSDPHLKHWLHCLRPCALVSVWSASYMVCTTRSKLRCNHIFPRSRHGPYCVTRTLLGTHQQRKHDSAGSSQYQTSLHSKVSKHLCEITSPHGKIGDRPYPTRFTLDTLKSGFDQTPSGSSELSFLRNSIGYRNPICFFYFMFFSPLFLESRMGPLIVWLRLHSVTWTAFGHKPNFYDNSAVQKKKGLDSGNEYEINYTIMVLAI